MLTKRKLDLRLTELEVEVEILKDAILKKKASKKSGKKVAK